MTAMKLLGEFSFALGQETVLACLFPKREQLETF